MNVHMTHARTIVGIPVTMMTAVVGAVAMMIAGTTTVGMTTPVVGTMIILGAVDAMMTIQGGVVGAMMIIPEATGVTNC
jgi:hypothetical protein